LDEGAARAVAGAASADKEEAEGEGGDREDEGTEAAR